ILTGKISLAMSPMKVRSLALRELKALKNTAHEGTASGRANIPHHTTAKAPRAAREPSKAF
ncbi:MAG: hypothetical protein ACTIJ4_07925, partial [Halomonas sp.]|uniref:hypothetical protein n=1 Tax=Halomonas sp. TaxID=1486246 RepID=UPI003F9D869F